MASKTPTINPICPICLKSFPVVKMLSTCKHVFCQRCLTTHLTKSSPENAVIPCPTCCAESPLPENGLDGLVDYTRDGADEDGREVLGAVGGGVFFHEKQAESEEEEVLEVNKLCLGCKFKPKSPTVRAETLCEDCGQFPMCWDCSKVHSQNKATQDHVVTSLTHFQSKKEVTCKSHDQMMKSYCSTCARLVCHVCVMFEHGDHVIKKIGEAFRELVTDVSAVAKEKGKQLNSLRQMETALQEMKSNALGERGALVKAIEDHAEKCIEEILNQKKTLKAKVNAEYKVIENVTTCLERIPDVRQKMEDSVKQAKRTVSVRDLHPNDVEKLVNTRETLVEGGKLADKIFTGVYLKDYDQLVQQARPRFELNTIEFTIGNLIYETPHLQPAASTGATHQPESKEKLAGAIDVVNVVNVKPSMAGLRQCRLLFEKTYHSVECVANLGSEFVVVGKPFDDLPEQIEVFEFHCQHERRVMEYINGLRQIAVTPDGNLAVLWKHADYYYVRIFNSETWEEISFTNLKITQNISVKSFDVTACNEYVFLDTRVPQTVTIFKSAGSFHLSQRVREGSLRIACGENFVFVSRLLGIDVYELRTNQLVYIASSKPFECIWNVSATTSSDEVTVICEQDGHCCFGRSLMSSGGFSEWSFEEIEQDIGEGNISVHGKHVVTCNNGKVRVFSYE